MSALKNIFGGLDRRKAKMFSIFLLCSFLAWFISNLSEPYESGMTFDLNYTNLPDTLLRTKGIKNELEAKVSANGFQFLYYNFSPKKINLDLSLAKLVNNQFYFPKPSLEREIDKQLSSNTKLVSVIQDTLFLNVYMVKSKEVVIKPNITLDLEQNYLLEGELTMTPNTVLLKGPANEIELVSELQTENLEMLDLTSDFSADLKLILPNDLANTVASSNSVRISGKVVRFSEKVFQANIVVLNGPEGFSIKTFPNSVSVLCKASIEDLKFIKENDFEVVADYQDRVEDKMFLNIKVSPEAAYDVRLTENQVNFILEKQ